jgi:hypothetical protein
VTENERKVEAATVLRAYQNIIARGVRSDDGHELDGVIAVADHDGYSVLLSDGTVTVRVLFHNRLAIEAPSGNALEQFVQRVEQLARRS